MMADTLEMMERIRKRREVMQMMAAPDEPRLAEAASSAFRDLYEGAIKRPARNVLAGYKAGASGMYDLGANALMLINRMGDYLTEKTGIGRMSKESAFGAAEQWLRDAARQVAPEAETLDDDVVSMIYQGLGSAPAAIAEYATGARTLGTVGGFAAVDALRAAQEGPEAAALAGLKGALLGGAFKGTEGLKRAPRTGALATLGGAAAAGEGGDIRDVTAGAATLATLGYLGGPGRVGLREIYRRPTGARQYPQEQARQDVLELVERVREEGPRPTAPRPEAAKPPAPAPAPVRPFQLPPVEPRPQPTTPEATAEAVAGRKPPSPARRTIQTAAGPGTIEFVDRQHAELFDLHSKPDKDATARLFKHFKGYVEGLKSPRQMKQLIEDHYRDTVETAEAIAKYRGGGPERQSMLIDPERQTDYLLRRIETTDLYTFPGPIAGIERAWRPVADRIIDTLAEGRYSPFRLMGGYPFKDPTMGKLPQRAEYLGRRGEAKGQIYRFNRMANTLSNALRKAGPVEQRAIFDYLTTKGADPKRVPDAYRGAAVASKSTIKKMGRELVRRGLLSEEAYQKHADAYLPRIYLKFLLDRSPFTTGLRLSEQGYLKQRIEDLPKEYRDLYLGEVRDPGFLVTKAVSVPARDLALQDFLRDLTYNGEWVLPQSTVQWTAPGLSRPRKVTPFWLKAESEFLRDRARRMEDPAAQQRATAIADQMRDTADQALGALKGTVPKEYRQMPDTPRYGDLRGLVVRKEIYNDIVGEGRLWIGEKGFYEKTWDKLGTANAIWKMMKVPLNPPTQIRNFVSNGVLLHLSGVPMANMPVLYARALREIAKNGKHYRVAVKHGIPASTFAAEELVQIMPDILRVKGQKGGVASSLYKMAEPLARLAKAPSDLYQFSETWGKTVKIIDAMERQGLTERQAASAAQDALFDYSLVPPLVKALRTRPIGAPFITFYYKAFPAVSQAAIRNPGKMAMYYLIPYLLGDALLANLRDVEPEDVDSLRQALPEWMREQGHTYIFPYKDESGRWTFTNFGYFLPWAMHERTLRNVAELSTGDYEGSVNDLFSELGILGGPVPQVGAVLMTGIDPFTQRRVFGETDPPNVQLWKAMTYAWRMAGPSWLTDRGVVGHVQRSMEGEPNYYGEPPMSVPQALARGAGVNIYPVDPEATRGRNLRRMGFDIEEIRRAGRRAVRHPKLSDEEREELRQQYREMMERAIARLREYEKRSIVHPSLR